MSAERFEFRTEHSKTPRSLCSFLSFNTFCIKITSFSCHPLWGLCDGHGHENGQCVWGSYASMKRLSVWAEVAQDIIVMEREGEHKNTAQNTHKWYIKCCQTLKNWTPLVLLAVIVFVNMWRENEARAKPLFWMTSATRLSDWSEFTTETFSYGQHCRDIRCEGR